LLAAYEFFFHPPLHTAQLPLELPWYPGGLACLGKYHGFALGLGLIGFV